MAINSFNRYLSILILIGTPLFLNAQTVVFSTRKVIDDTLERAKKNVVVDVDLDNDLDIVCTANPEGSSGAESDAAVNVVLFLNDGNESFVRKTVDFRFRTARGLAAGDLNGDGYPDLAVGNANVDSFLVWYENPVTSYDTRWRKRQVGVAAPLNYVVRIVDFDGDGDKDIVDGFGDTALGGTLTGDYIRWLENDGAATPAFTEHLLINYPSPSGIGLGDLDGDGDLDVAGQAWTTYASLTASADEDVRWWSRETLTSYLQQEIIKTAYGGNDLQTADMDGDGDLDLIGAGYKNQSVDWWANDGAGNFGSSMFTVRSAFSYTRNVQVKDLDGDGDLDIVTCADNDNTVLWLENDGSQNFTEHVLDNSFTYAYYVTPVDLDGDGDVDVVGTAEQAVESGNTILGQLAWWENLQAEEQTLASGDPAPASYYSGKVVIDFQSGFSGGLTSVFYNHGTNENRSSVGGGIDHIALSGFYTIRTKATTYDGTIDFYYANISEWSAINNEADLRICYWDGSTSQWIPAGTSQSVDAVNNKITVSGISGQLADFSFFTLGSVSTDNSLPVQLLSFEYEKQPDGILLFWQTASELENQGFEIWRRTDTDTLRELVASFKNDVALQGLGNSNSGGEYRYFDGQVVAGQTYFYELYDVSYSGRRTKVAGLSVAFVPQDLTRVVQSTLPTKLTLNPNFPNPFNQSTIISFDLPALGESLSQNVRILIFDVNGRLVLNLFAGALSAGQYRVRWDGKNQNGMPVPSGTYICFLQGQKARASRLITLVR